MIIKLQEALNGPSHPMPIGEGGCCSHVIGPRKNFTALNFHLVSTLHYGFSFYLLSPLCGTREHSLLMCSVTIYVVQTTTRHFFFSNLMMNLVNLLGVVHQGVKHVISCCQQVALQLLPNIGMQMSLDWDFPQT